jgi:hypothetical protein
MGRLDEVLVVEIVVLESYCSDEVEDVGECRCFFEYSLQLFELLGF